MVFGIVLGIVVLERRDYLRFRVLGFVVWLFCFAGAFVFAFCIACDDFCDVCWLLCFWLACSAVLFFCFLLCCYAFLCICCAVCWLLCFLLAEVWEKHEITPS